MGNPPPDRGNPGRVSPVRRNRAPLPVANLMLRYNPHGRPARGRWLHAGRAPRAIPSDGRRIHSALTRPPAGASFPTNDTRPRSPRLWADTGGILGRWPNRSLSQGNPPVSRSPDRGRGCRSPYPYRGRERGILRRCSTSNRTGCASLRGYGTGALTTLPWSLFHGSGRGPFPAPWSYSLGSGV